MGNNGPRLGNRPGSATMSSGNVSTQSNANHTNATQEKQAESRQTGTSTYQLNPQVAAASYEVSSFTDGPQRRNPLPPPTQESLRIANSTDNSRPIDRKGLNEQRPEILATFQLEPIYEDSDSIPGSVGDMLDYQLSSRQLRAENISRLINELKSNEATRDLVEELEQQISVQDSSAEREVQFLEGIVRRLQATEKSFNIKLNERAIEQEIASRRVRDRRAPGDGTAARSVKSPREILINELSFSNVGYRSFTNSKIIAQLLDDLRVIAPSFSPQIFDSSNEVRANDVSSTKIIPLDDPTAGAAVVFDIQKLALSTSSEVRDGAKATAFNKFQGAFSSLIDPDDRLKVLFSILSKELRVSTGLSTNVVVSTLRNTFNTAAEGNVYSRIIGRIGTDAMLSTDPSIDSIASLIRARAGDQVVMPFEQVVVRSGLTQRAIPGKTFYIDSIIQGQEKFNTNSLNEYATAFNAATNGLALIAEGTLDVNVINRERLGLSVRDLMQKVVAPISDGIKAIADRSSSSDPFTPALLAAAATDNQLRRLLYVYILLFMHIRNDLVQSGQVPADQQQTVVETMNRAGLTKDVIVEEIRKIALDPLEAQLSQQRAAIAESLERGIDSAGQVATATATEIDRIKNTPAQIIIADVIMRRIFNRYRRNQIDSTKEFLASFEFNKLASFGIGSPGNYFVSMAEVVQSIDSLARSVITGTDTNENVDGYYSNQDAGLTKFSKLGVNQIIHIILDIYISLFSKFAPITITGAKFTPRVDNGTAFSVAIVDESPKLEVNIDESRVEIMNIALSSFLNSGHILVGNVAEDRRQEILRYRGDLEEIRSKAIREDELIRDIIDVFLSISNLVSEQAEQTKRFFDTLGPNANSLTSIRQSIDSDDKISSLSAAQVVLSRIELDESRSSRANSAFLTDALDDISSQDNPGSPFVGDATILPGVRNALFNMMRDSAFTASSGKNAQILTIGLPAGFSDSLRLRNDTFSVGTNLEELERRRGLQSDIVQVNVYMQDLMYDDLIFKPKKYIFELGRFVNSQGFSDVSPFTDFNTNVALSIQQRVLVQDESMFVEGTGAFTTDDESYSFLADSQKQELVRNHIVSYLLGVYVRLLTGVSLNESNFLINEAISLKLVDDETKKTFIEILENHVSQFINKRLTIDELVAANPEVSALFTRLDSNVDTTGVVSRITEVIDGEPSPPNIEISQDIITFMNAFSPDSILFGAGSRRSRIVSPKMFERIFTILVDPDEFEIDVEKTRQTSAGQAILASNSYITRHVTNESDEVIHGQFSVGSGIVRNIVKLDAGYRKPQSDIGLRQFFVAIEQLPEQSPLLPTFQRNSPRYGDISSIQPAQRTSRTNQASRLGSQEKIELNRQVAGSRDRNTILRTSNPNRGRGDVL